MGMKAVIMAGGGGTRLWPISRISSPKQVTPFTDQEALLQKTYARLEGYFDPRDIWVAVGVDHLEQVREQLPSVPDENYSIEPERKDTAAAIGLAAIRIAAREPDAVLVTINSDAYLRDTRSYFRAVRVAEKAIEYYPDHTVLIGVRPAYPETGYGYIRLGREVRRIDRMSLFRVSRFVEKPTLPRARRYVREGRYLWNPALFVWKVSYLLELFAEHLPRTYHVLRRIEQVFGRRHERRETAREYARIRPISIDYGILEKTRRMLVVPGRFDWVDVGHWRTVHEVLAPRPGMNVVDATHIGIDTSGSFIRGAAGKLIATVGVHDMIIVDTEDALLICPRERAQDVKQIVTELGQRGMTRYL
jgi:mannose-1-phosphate guanylyltransferase